MTSTSPNIRAVFAVLITASLSVCGCEPGVYTGMQAEPPLPFSMSQSISLPNAAAHQAFSDVDGDGVVDLVELIETDEARWRVDIFSGKLENSSLSFASHAKPVRLIGIHQMGAADFSIGDANGDARGDLILVEPLDQRQSEEAVRITICVNANRQPLEFKCTNQLTSADSDGLSSAVGPAIVEIAKGRELLTAERIKTDLRIDWADMDGDGRDDLVVLTKGGDLWKNDLAVDVLFGNGMNSDSSTVLFTGRGQADLPGLLSGRSLDDLVLGRFNDDKKADILVHDRGTVNNSLRLSLSINASAGRGALEFASHGDFQTQKVNFDYSSKQKTHSFDISNDGCADYIFAGRVNGAPKLSYHLFEGC